jgi:hypothetical protein
MIERPPITLIRPLALTMKLIPFSDIETANLHIGKYLGNALAFAVLCRTYIIQRLMRGAGGVGAIS